MTFLNFCNAQTALGYHAFRENATWFLLGLFTLEYLVRVWCCIEDTSLSFPKHAIRSRIAWMTRPMPLVDVLSLVPFYIERMGFACVNPKP
jgi:voltage-gated potassium channel